MGRYGMLSCRGMADALRTEIDAAGWTVLDGRDGYKIVKKS